MKTTRHITVRNARILYPNHPFIKRLSSRKHGPNCFREGEGICGTNCRCWCHRWIDLAEDVHLSWKPAKEQA